MIEIKKVPQGLIFRVYAQPRASKNQIVGAYQNALKIKLSAPPVEGAANQKCLEVLSKALSVPKSALTITGGLTSRHKEICLEHRDPDHLKRIILRLRELAHEAT
jgi:uncharacterized protein